MDNKQSSENLSVDDEITSQTSQHKHEQASTEMFDYLVAENKLLPEFDKYGLTELDRVFIKEQIDRPSEPETTGSSTPDQKEWTLKGRPKEKSFLYEVVANKRNGIDVDKWDYFARDCHMLGIRNNFDHNRCIEFSRVLDSQICYRDKEVGNLYDMFHTRRTLHSRAYQHKTTKIIEKMVTEALVKANDFIKFNGKDGKKLKMSESIHDMKAFSQMTDHVFNLIVSSTDTDLNEAREILKKVLRRELYKFVEQTQMLKDVEKETLIAAIDKLTPEGYPSAEDIIIFQLVTLDYGMKDKNPIGSVRFYSKDEPSKAGPIRQDQKPSFIPDHFKEQQTRIYSKELDTGFLKVVREVLNSLSDKNPESGDKNSPDEKDKSTKSSNDTEG